MTSFGEMEFEYNQTSTNLALDVDKYSTLHGAQKFLRNILTPTICIFGFCGNSVNLVVLSLLCKRKTDGARESGTQLGLIVLAMSDLCFCIFMFPRGFVPEHKSLFEVKDFWLYYQVCATKNAGCLRLPINSIIPIIFLYLAYEECEYLMIGIL